MGNVRIQQPMSGSMGFESFQLLNNTDTLEPHYNAHFGVHSDISVITEQPYEGLID